MTYQVLAHPDVRRLPQDDDVPIRRSRNRLPSGLLKLLPPDWRILLGSRETDEPLIETYGAVEIRQVPPGCAVHTRVKGEMDVARRTALLRLVRYVSGENRSGVAVEPTRPIMQIQKAPGRWLVGVRLAGIRSVLAAPVPRTSKVRIEPFDAETLAVLRVRGRPTEWSIAQAEVRILSAIATTGWFAKGTPILRFAAPRPLLPFTGGYEVALHVSRQQASLPVPGPTAINRPATTASPPAH